MLGKICFALAANAPAIAATGGTELTAAERVFLVAQDAYAKNRGAELQRKTNCAASIQVFPYSVM